MRPPASFRGPARARDRLLVRHEDGAGDETRKPLGKFARVTALHAVGDPDQRRLRLRRDEIGDRRNQSQPVRNERHGFDGAQTLQRLRSVGSDDLVAAVGRCHERDRLATPCRLADPLRRRRHAKIPGGCRRPAIVNHQQQSAAAAFAARQRIEDGTGHRENDRGRDGQAQDEQPPGRMGRRLVARAQIENESQRRKRNPVRPRRGDPQQVVEHRQTGEGDEHRRDREGERQPEHQPATLANCPSRSASSRIRSASKASDAGRSVRCGRKLQPRRRAAVVTASRCAARREI